MSLVIKELQDAEMKRALYEYDLDHEAHMLTEDDFAPLSRYILERIPPGDFLMSVLENDLTGAMSNADVYNRRRIFEYCKYLWNRAPANCWGSPEKVALWLSRD